MEVDTKRPSDKALNQVGILLIVAGVVIGMGIAWIGNLPMGLMISMIVVALACVAAGLALSRRFSAKDDI